MSIVGINPCVSCGACCALFRVSFYWSEIDPVCGGKVPAALTNKLNAHRVSMKGTDSQQPRCVCLQGIVGEQVYCDIYPLRPSTCREFTHAWQDGAANERCDNARLAWNLPPLPAPNPIEPIQPDTPRAA